MCARVLSIRINGVEQAVTGDSLRHKGPKSLLTIIMQVIRSFLQELRSRESNFSQKAIVPKKRRFSHIFLILPTMADIE